MKLNLFFFVILLFYNFTQFDTNNFNMSQEEERKTFQMSTGVPNGKHE